MEDKQGEQQEKGVLASQIDEAGTEYMRIAPPPGETASVDPDVLNKAISRLDGLFWKRVDEVVAERLGSVERGKSKLPFTDDDRLLLDFGLLDVRLLGAQAPGIKKRLLNERREQPPAGISIIYLSDWLESRYQYYLTIEEADKLYEISQYIHSAPEIVPLVERRETLLSLLQPFMRHLPGVNETLSRFIMEGRLDDLVLRLFVERIRTQGADVEERLIRIESAFRYVMRKVAERVIEDRFLQVIDEYNTVRLEIFRHVNRIPKEVMDKSERTADVNAVVNKVRGEIKLIRSLLNLGTITGAISKPHSVLLRDIPRATVSSVGSTMALAIETDPKLSLEHSVLIAPFTGSGFFEWDRDTLIVSLIPERTVDEDVATAVASMRIALDRFQHDEELKRAYERLHPGKDFREVFTRDYVQWVLRVGRGQKQQMDARSFEFFLKYIGHNGVDPVVPPEIAHTTVAERDKLSRAVVEKARDNKASARELFLAGIIRWQKGDKQSASRYLESAAKISSEDGSILYSLGILLRNMRMKGPARRYLVQCTRVAPQTIWQVYAFEALKKL